VTELARRAGVGFANAHRELHAMKGLGLVVADREARAESFHANAAHPLARALRALVAAPVAATPDGDAERTRAQLRALGAPLLGGRSSAAVLSVEEVVVRGAILAHRDPAVARTLPLCIWNARDRIDAVRLRETSRRLGEREAVGFFLELTAALSGDARFVEWSRPLRDRRRTVPRDFFPASSASRYQSRLAASRTPAVARRWGLRMNMGLESFRTLFERFAGAA
jgi:hypothetical protein